MARVNGLNKITGTVGNVTFYTIQGGDQVYMRGKGGPSKRAIKRKPQFEKLRNNNNEWKGCAGMGKQIRISFRSLNCLEDYPISGALNALCKEIQKLDTEAEHGRRNIYLSKHKEVLLGLSFSKKQVLESVLRVPVESSLDRASGKAEIHIPALNTDTQLYNFRKLPYYRILATLGGVCDMLCSENGKSYYHDEYNYCSKADGIYQSEWLTTMGKQPAMDIKLGYPLFDTVIPEVTTIVLSLGIEFGTIGSDGLPEAVKYSGTGKVLRTA